jgi:hypothetical protein
MPIGWPMTQDPNLNMVLVALGVYVAGVLYIRWRW